MCSMETYGVSFLENESGIAEVEYQTERLWLLGHYFLDLYAEHMFSEKEEAEVVLV